MPFTYSVVIASTVGPFQLLPACGVKRINATTPGAIGSAEAMATLAVPASARCAARAEPLINVTPLMEAAPSPASLRPKP